MKEIERKERHTSWNSWSLCRSNWTKSNWYCCISLSISLLCLSSSSISCWKEAFTLSLSYRVKIKLKLILMKKDTLFLRSNWERWSLRVVSICCTSFCFSVVSDEAAKLINKNAIPNKNVIREIYLSQVYCRSQ